MVEENNNLDSWDAFTGNYLRAEDVKSKDDVYVCVNATEELFDEKKKVKLTLERNEIPKDFTLNATNIKAIRDLGFESPKSVIGCKICFDTVKQRNPNTNTMVDSLLIRSVEKVE